MNVTAQVDLMMSQIPASDKQLMKIACETQLDPLSRVIQCMGSGWTSNQCQRLHEGHLGIKKPSKWR